MRKIACWALLSATVAALCGCGANYTWRSGTPEAMRTVSVPMMRNDSEVSELGAIATRQVLREFQREGTFKIRPVGDAALEIQGVIKSTTATAGAYSRRSGLRTASYNYEAKAEISVIDKRSRKVLVDNRPYTARTVFTSGRDLTTAQRDASGRLAEDLARQVVDDVVNLKWE